MSLLENVCPGGSSSLCLVPDVPQELILADKQEESKDNINEEERLTEMFDNIPVDHIRLVLRINDDLEETITWLLNYSKNVSEGSLKSVTSLMGLKLSKGLKKL